MSTKTMKRFDGDQTKWRLCLGCGACTDSQATNGRALYDFTDEGIRAIVKDYQAIYHY